MAAFERLWQSRHDALRVLLPSTAYILSVVVTFASQVVLGRVLGLESYGIFSAVYAEIAIAASLVTLGLDISALKFASQYQHFGQHSLFRRFLQFGSLLILVSSVALFAAAVAFSRVVVELGSNLTLVPLLVVATWALTKFLASCLRALNFQSTSIFVDKILRDSFIACAVLYWIMVYGQRPTVEFATSALMAGSIAGLLVSGAIVLVYLPAREIGKPVAQPRRRDWVLTSLAMWGANVLELAYSRSEVIALARSGHAEDAGLFSVLLTLSTLLLLPLLALNVVFQPRIAAQAAAGGGDGLRAEVRKFANWSWPINIALGALILLLPRQFMSLFGAHDVSVEAVTYLYGLVLSRMILSPIGPSASVLLMANGHQTLLGIYVVALLAKLTAIWLLLPLSLVEAGAISICGTLATQFLIYLASRRILNS